MPTGNVVFTSAATDTTAMAAALARAIAESLSVRPRVVVLSREELSQMVADNPYPDECWSTVTHSRVWMCFKSGAVALLC